jgi:hypothetical protein
MTKAKPKTPVVNCRNRTAEQCKQISETLKESYAKGRRFRRAGFPKTAEPKK